MYKALIGAGALLLATTAVPASAHDGYDDGYYGNGYDNNDNSGYDNNGYYNNGYNNGYGYNRYGYRDDRGDDYDTIRWHVRACRQHARFHEALNAVHDREHEQGFDSYDEHRDVHEALNEAHEEYHENHPGATNCAYWYSQYYNWNHRYGYDRPDRSYSYSYGGGY